MDKYNSVEDALREICRNIYILDKEAEFNESTKPVFNASKHVILTKTQVEELFSLRNKATRSFTNLLK